jgi:hypothetical protein
MEKEDIRITKIKENLKTMKTLDNFNLVLGISIGLFVGFWLGWYACVYFRGGL